MKRPTNPGRFGALLATALIVGLVGAAPASAVVDTSFSCPGSIEPAGFSDIAGHPDSTRRAIDCLALYGITRGTGPTTFDPAGSVPRWQMALFLVRQAVAHGMTIPEASDQGFGDLDGLSREAIDAINQLGGLGITLGTSADTFSPHANVTRWQMALFITRLLAGSGMALPAASDGGFEDLDGLSAQARDAIDQLAALGVAEGTGATTFSPFTETLRWQMALFLTRALAVGGLFPPGAGSIDISPSTPAVLDFGGSSVARQYTATVAMSGPFGVELWPADLVRQDGSFDATEPGPISNCDVTLVDGGFHSADSVSGITATAGSFTFTVGCTGLHDAIVPVVYAGDALAGLDGADSLHPALPTNAYGIGGSLTVVAEATASPFGPVVVDSVDVASKSFVSNGVTYFWDENDTFKSGGVDVTMSEWEAALTTGDDLLAGSIYDGDPAGSSVFDLQDDSPEAPVLTVESVTSDSVTLTYVAPAGPDHLEVYLCEGTGCETTLTRSVVIGTDEDADAAGTQIVITGLTAATDYDVQATLVEGADVSPKSEALDVDTPVALSIVDVAVSDVNDSTDGWTYLFLIFDQDVAVDGGAALSDFQIHVVSQPAIPYSAVSTPSLVLGTSDQLAISFEFQADTDPDTDWVLTIAPGALDVGAGGDPNGGLTAEFSH